MAFTNKKLGAGSPLLTKEMLQSRLGTIPADKTVAEYINENKGIKIAPYDGATTEGGVPTADCGPSTKYTQDTLWLVKQSEGEDPQMYDEYIVVSAPDGAPKPYVWEKLGSHEIPENLVTYENDKIIVGNQKYLLTSIDIVDGTGTVQTGYTILKEVNE